MTPIRMSARSSGSAEGTCVRWERCFPSRTPDEPQTFFLLPRSRLEPFAIGQRHTSTPLFLGRRSSISWPRVVGPTNLKLCMPTMFSRCLPRGGSAMQCKVSPQCSALSSELVPTAQICCSTHVSFRLCTQHGAAPNTFSVDDRHGFGGPCIPCCFRNPVFSCLSLQAQVSSLPTSLLAQFSATPCRLCHGAVEVISRFVHQAGSSTVRASTIHDYFLLFL